MTFFRKVQEGTGNATRYRFSGYTSWEMPDLIEGKYWPFIVSNWMLPIATNPIAVEAMDLKGASFTPTAPDTDFATLYQTTLFDLDKDLYDIFGRPAVMGDDGFVTYRDIIGTCAQPAPACGAFAKLTEADFPDHVISLVLGWKQMNKWAVGGENQPYETMNPSHVFDPDWGAIVGPGAYHTAVLTDFAGDPAKRKQLLVVPSTIDEPGNPDRSVIYFVDPEGEHLVGRFAKSDIDYNTPSCTTKWNYQELPLILPTWKAIPKPRVMTDPMTSIPGNYVPYEVKTGDLDGDSCEDLVITWRGKKTKADAVHQEQVVFDDESTPPNTNMFANEVSIVLRHEDAGQCVFQLPQDSAGDQYPGSLIPKFIRAQSGHMWFASAAIGDFDGDGLNDIATGNAFAEYTNGVDPTAYARVYHQGGAVPFSTIDATRVRVGFHVGDPDMGVASIEANRNLSGPDALAQVNGRPLMLPEIGCPDNGSPSPTPVGSVFESYVSIFSNLASTWAVVKMPNIFEIAHPFVDSGDRPIPQRCATPPEKCMQGVFDLPFYEGDECCKDHCAEITAAGGFQNWLQQSPCGQYLLKYATLSCSIFRYGQQLYNLCDPNASLPDKNAGSRAFAEADDSGGDSDFAAHRPDTVVGYDGHAIGVASAMRFAQAAPAGQMLDVQGAGNVAVAPIRSYGDALKAAIGPFESMNVPLEKLLEVGLFQQFASDPEMARQIEAMKASGEIARFGKRIDAYLKDRLIGPPQSFEDIFIRPMVMTTLVAVNEAQSEQGASGSASAGRFGFLSGAGCTLAAGPAVQEQIKIVPKKKVIQTIEPMIPYGGSTGCGNGYITGNEQCDPQSSETNYGCSPAEKCFAGDADGVSVFCACARCGDGIVQNGQVIVNGVVQSYEEACDGAPCQNGVDCSNTCTCYAMGQPTCGNNTKDPGESCDFVNGVATGCSVLQTCTSTCQCVQKMIDKIPDYDMHLVKCGNGIKEGAEECDEPNAVPGQYDPNSACAASGSFCVSATCKCQRPTCGDSFVTNPGWPPPGYSEECDYNALNTCASGQICDGSCKCVGGGFVPPPPLNYKIKLPKGRLMPGYREMTAVVMKTPKGTTGNLCNPGNGIVDPGEECDLKDIALHGVVGSQQWKDDLKAQCDASQNPPGPNQVPLTCSQWCTCAYENLNCLDDPNAECKNDGMCALTQYCGSDCACHDKGGGGTGPGGGGVPADTPNSEDILASTQNDCYVHCDSFSGDVEAEIYKKWNDRIRAVTGRNDDLFCESEQKVTVLCRVGAGSAPDVANLSLSLSGTPLPDSAQNLRPYMFVQLSGKEFVDSGTLEYKQVTPVTQALRILPVEGVNPTTQKETQIVLPDLSSSPDLAPLAGISPMATTSVQFGVGGAVAINNMIQHEVFSVMPGQDYSISIGGSSQTIKAQAAGIPSGAAITIHEYKMIMPPDYASWTGVDGGELAGPNIEDRQFDGDQVIAVLESRMSAYSGVPTAAIYAELPWDKVSIDDFKQVQAIYGEPGAPEPPPVELSVTVGMGKPMFVGSGSGCGCYVANGATSLGSIAPFIVAMLVPLSGLAMGAVRRRRRR
jgi:MYXO-CTERM domain-containing protein